MTSTPTDPHRRGDTPQPPVDLRDALERAATAFPHRGLALFDRRGRLSERRTYPQLLEAARRGAACWAALGIEPGDRVVVALPASREWFEGWLGALLVGALPVAVAPGAGVGHSEAVVRKISSVVDRLAARRAIVTAGCRREAQHLGAEGLTAVAMTTETLVDAVPGRWSPPAVDPDEVAFLQLTSGSTGVPRAVQITHRSVLENVAAIDEAIGAPLGAPTRVWADGVVSWLPLHHDMGLIGCLWLAVTTGLDLWLLPPPAFLARPSVWLRELSARGKVVSHAPSFGYQLCLERIPAADRERVDLSGWRAATVGAEMVRPETLAAFADAFRGAGFDPLAVRPSYGLAEAALAVTVDVAGRGLRTRPAPPTDPAAGTLLAREAEEVACVGTAVRDTVIRITAPDGRTLQDGAVGEVRVRGPGIFRGYLGDAQGTAEVLVDGELRTGDLGFLVDGELYLTGRLKEVLILRGHNVMPHEIEWLAESVGGSGGACRAGAFSIPARGEGEQAVLVLEVDGTGSGRLGALEREIRLRVGRELSLVLADVAFVRRGRIPKTTSGKVQRRALRDLYLEGALTPWAAGSDG